MWRTSRQCRPVRGRGGVAPAAARSRARPAPSEVSSTATRPHRPSSTCSGAFPSGATGSRGGSATPMQEQPFVGSRPAHRRRRQARSRSTTSPPLEPTMGKDPRAKSIARWRGRRCSGWCRRTRDPPTGSWRRLPLGRGRGAQGRTGFGQGDDCEGKLATLAVAVTAAGILTAAAFSPPRRRGLSRHSRSATASRRSVSTVPHTTGLRPPAVRLSTKPARDLRCYVLSYRYHAIRRKGAFGARIRCTRVGRGARGRLVFPPSRTCASSSSTTAPPLSISGSTSFPGPPPPRSVNSGPDPRDPVHRHPTGSHVGTHVSRRRPG